MTVPTGNGQQRGMEAADGPGTPLPGSRPSRAAANNARNRSFLRETPVAAQGGFGTEDMHVPAAHLSTANVRWSDVEGGVPDLAAMGNAGETFGGS